MKSQFTLGRLTFGIGVLLLACGCQEAAQVAENAEKAAESTAETIAKDAEAVVKEGGEMASDLGQAAMSYISPLKEKFGGLEALKDTPAELKTAVTELIQSIEGKAESVTLPDAVTTALATVKEKLVALRDYLEGEVDQAKIEEHLQGIMESVKSGLGVSG